ncbi:hypothetical protein EK904_013898, partial [Melospiza melodia maxima]
CELTKPIPYSYNSLRKLSATDFAGLEKLELLMLHSNEISTVPEKAFRDLHSLQVLKMSYNKVRVLQQDVFYGLNSLVRLHMDHNQIEFVNPNVFYGLTSLRLVHLDGNFLQQLHPDTFVTLRYSQIFRISFLKHISLSDNALTSLPQEMFSYMSELESIYLHGNPWSCDCSLQGLAGWAQERPDIIKCRKERSSGVQQCPVCASPKTHNGKSLADLPSASFTCTKPVIDDSLKSRNLSVPDDGDFSFVSPKDLMAPIGSVVLNMTDQAGNRGNLVCDVQRPKEMSPISFDQSGPSRVLQASFSAFLVCGIDYGHIQQLWSILALYSSSPLKLEQTVGTAEEPSASHKYRQAYSEKDELFTRVEAELRAEPAWLLQRQRGWQDPGPQERAADAEDSRPQRRPSGTAGSPRALGEPAAPAASSQGTQPRNSHGNLPHRPHTDRTGRRFRARRRQFVPSGRRADPQRWAALLQKTKRNSTVADKRGEAATEPPVQAHRLSEVPGDEEEASGDLVSPEEEFMIPATERSPVPALGRATELTITAGPKGTENPPPAWSTSVLLSEPITPLPSPPPHPGAPASKRLQTLLKPADSQERSNLSQISANGVKQPTVPNTPQSSPSTMKMPLEHPMGTLLREEEKKHGARQKAAATVVSVTAEDTAPTAASGLGATGLKPTVTLVLTPQTNTRAAKTKMLRVGGRRARSVPSSAQCSPPALAATILFLSLCPNRMGSRIHVYPNGSLAIEAVTEKDAGDYLCVARNRIGEDLILMKVSIAMEPAKIDHKQQFKKLVPYGKGFRVDCKASGSPTPAISWGLPDGTVVNDAMLADDSGHGARRYVLFHNGTLHLNKAGVAEGGDYTCYAQNTLGRDEMKIHVTVVVAAPQIKHNHKTHVAVTAGDTAQLDCEAAGEPRAQIFWLLPSSEMISSSTDRHSLHANGSLSIGQAGLLDAGEYLCVARNPGGDDSKLYRLAVAAKAPIINGLHRNKTIMKVTAVRHSKKHINCRAEGTPPPQIMWIMPDNIFLTAPYYGSRVVVHKNGTLEIRNIRPSDTGDFICVARNDGGETVLVVQLEVTEMLRRPMFKNPFNEKIIAKPGKPITLNCSVDGNPAPDISWMLPNGTL